jgi:type II secretory pathway predicted ATPase ExeA
MFLEFYRLRQQPFGVTPDPAYLYLTRTHREALTALLTGIKEGRGFFALIAEPGMGKTTLLYELLDELHDSARTVFMFQTQCDAREFFQYLLSELGVDTKGMDLVTMHGKLNEVLFAEMVAGRRFVLVVDESQNLSDSVLETVRLLSNFETSYAKMLQIVLAGQPQLSEKLAQPQLAQLKQRLAVLAQIDPLSAAETGNYIEHRLKVAGYTGAPLFTPDALALVAQLSGGTPRVINHLCYGALATGYTQNREIIDSEIVRTAATKLGMISAPAAAQRVPENTSAKEGARVLPISHAVAPPAKPVVEAKAETAAEAGGALSYGTAKRSRLPRWAFRVLVLAGILLLAGIFLTAFVLRLTEPDQAKLRGAATDSSASPATRADAATPGASRNSSNGNGARSAASDSSSYSADPEESGSVQMITVAVKPGQTLRDISLLYIGRYDDALFNQIVALNPELKDPDHVEPGQLIRLPLPAGSFRKGKVFTPEEEPVPVN